MQSNDAFIVGRELEVLIDADSHIALARVPHDAVSVHDGRTVVLRAGTLRDDELDVELGAADEEWVEIRNFSAGTRVRRGR